MIKYNKKGKPKIVKYFDQIKSQAIKNAIDDYMKDEKKAPRKIPLGEMTYDIKLQEAFLTD